MTITRQRLNQILKEEVHRELQEQKLLQEKINVDKETYQKIMAKIIENAILEILIPKPWQKIVFL